jgi:hypothetical protein
VLVKTGECKYAMADVRRTLAYFAMSSFLHVQLQTENANRYNPKNKSHSKILGTAFNYFMYYRVASTTLLL